ncbi:MAG TPA: FHA domain-containing protein [Gemmataceae bacterium]|nr:FHA domain-containing protein [Gemmataceae bacterium]
MEAENPGKGAREVGVLVLQTGRQAGARRPLGVPTTFLGRGQNCDIRVNVDGVDPLHCLIVCARDGVHLRDLDSASGTFVNGERADNAILQHGDILKVGPFQFRLELNADSIAEAESERALEEMRDALRIQAAAIVAQQAALEEEEARLEQSRSNLREEELQVAARLEEKQQQVQLLADFTRAERDAMRKEKAEQDTHLAKLEQELWQAKEEVAKQQQDVAKARLRIDKIYQRLRQRWQRQWAGQRQKQQEMAAELAAEQIAFKEREQVQQQHEVAFADEVIRANTERELAQRRLREDRESLQREQEAWRRRRSQEQLVLKNQARNLEETQLRIADLRELLAQERQAWEKQQELLHKELHGVNNRIVHQRLRVQEQQAEIARLEVIVAQRRAESGEAPPASTESQPLPKEIPEETMRRCVDLDRLAGELADQRVHLLEQYDRLAGIQADWQAQREQASSDLEALARRLIDEEQALTNRENNIVTTEESLQQRTRELEAIQLDVQQWRAQLKAREQALAQQHQQETLALKQHQKLLEDQLAGLATLRQRWNKRRQQEIDRLQAERSALAQEQKQTQDRRLLLFEKNQEVEAEKRALAEKALALEQYRQEVFTRAADPGAQRRIDRLRRRWLSVNSALIRNAKSAADTTRREFAELEALRAELVQATGKLIQDEASWADKKAALEQREETLNILEQRLEIELRKTRPMSDNPDDVSQAIYDEFDDASKAA